MTGNVPAAPLPTGAAASDGEVAALTERRRRVRAWWRGAGAWADADHPEPPIGLALSGGGIRSATFALGLIQGLAKAPRDALARIDVLSTVSGGGYIGCFLRSLFVPTASRGIDRDAAQPEPGAIAEQYRFARLALGSAPCARKLEEPATEGVTSTVRNPMWWLREHSRYLAPSGPSDYGFAIAYVARNWIAMVYLFTLAAAALGVVVVGLEAAILAAFGKSWSAPHDLSPTIVAAPLLLAAAGAVMIAYWGTQAMSTNERSVDLQRARLRVGVRAILAGAVVVVIACALVAALMPYPGPAGLAARMLAIFGPVLTWVLVGGVVLSVVGALIGAADGEHFRDRNALLTAELRLSLTDRFARINKWLLALAAIVVVDTLAARLGGLRLTEVPFNRVALLPAMAFLIKKLPDWLGGTGKTGVIGPLLRRFASTIALVAGLLLYGLLAVGAFALVHHVTWDGMSWQPAANWPGLIALAAIILVLAVISGHATGFINLSSLHTLYASRLTRAYLGASNRDRLRLKQAAQAELTAEDRNADPNRRALHPHPVTENHPSDYIRPQIYGESDLPAPIHIINVTMNETIDPRSQIVARDRKGDVLSLEPDGVRVGDALQSWSSLATPREGDRHVESISLGQWCAISGAAASSAMGRMSNLGYALAFTFANIRLGYWWRAPDLCPEWPRVIGVKDWIASNFGTFVYLWNEMTCRYSRAYDRQYLTDGGHYENSGAYVLIRRGVPLILVSDCGADPDYAFDDMQVLIRQVRIDLGGETEILGDTALDAVLARFGKVDRAIFVDPVRDPFWERSMRDPNSRPFVLVLRTTIGARQIHLLWIKPRLLPGLAEDVVGYAAQTGSFPQQPTGDQFFDEAQWESYRLLGEESMNRLLAACPALLAPPVSDDAAT